MYNRRQFNRIALAFPFLPHISFPAKAMPLQVEIQGKIRVNFEDGDFVEAFFSEYKNPIAANKKKSVYDCFMLNSKNHASCTINTSIPRMDFQLGKINPNYKYDLVEYNTIYSGFDKNGKMIYFNSGKIKTWTMFTEKTFMDYELIDGVPHIV